VLLSEEEGSDVLPDGSLILLVEDEALLAMEVEAALIARRWRVLGPAPSVERALQLIDDEPPALGLLDVNVRGKLVTPVAERLRSLGVPFLLLSAYNTKVMSHAILSEATNVGKPFNEGRLLEAIYGLSKMKAKELDAARTRR
jgi:DNA-binding response OmpR family regulator